LDRSPKLTTKPTQNSANDRDEYVEYLLEVHS